MEKNVDLNTLLDSVPVQVWSLISPSMYSVVNEAHAKFLGLKKVDTENKEISTFLPPSEVKNIIKQNRKAFKEKKKITSEEWVNWGKKEAFLRINWIPKIDKKGKVYCVVCSAEDFTEIKIKEEQAQFLSFRDELTKLYNRRFFEEQMKRLDTKRQLPISLIVADVNNLKIINDTYGHKLGDELLKCAAKILHESCRKEDIIARLGGDEFVVLLTKTDEKNAEKIAKRITNFCKAHDPICNINSKIPISIAIGVATKTNMDQNIKKILKIADTNMYSNKLSIKSKEEQ
jgi:diguanylate cyclase (GGDEF)-like protein